MFNGLINLNDIKFRYNKIKVIHENTLNRLSNIKNIIFIYETEEINSKLMYKSMFNDLATKKIYLSVNEIKIKKKILNIYQFILKKFKTILIIFFPLCVYKFYRILKN